MSDEAAADSGSDKSYDLSGTREALIDAAGISISLWVSYLLVLTYMLVAVASVTHDDLLFANSIRLPVLSVDLPSAGFFLVGPPLFLIVHTYVLLHFVLLAQKVAAFDHALRRQVTDTDTRARMREQLPINIFVQFLAGPERIRDGFIGVLLWLIALISLVLAPVALMVFFQVQFLPYHEVWITWWQRILAVMEVALVCVLWPKVGLRESPRKNGLPAYRESWPAWGQRVFTNGTMALVIVVPAPFLFGISTFPGEALNWRTTRDCAGDVLGDCPQSSGILAQAYALVVGAGFDYVSDERRPSSLWPNRLVVSGVSVVDRTKTGNEFNLMNELKEARDKKLFLETASFRGRDLSQAVLVDAKLQGVSLAKTNLARGVMAFASLQYADLSRADLREAILREAQLNHAILAKSCLKGANLQSANLTGASLADADLTNATLANANLTDADLSRATLNGVDLKNANLTRAILIDVDLTHVKNFTMEQQEQAFGNGIAKPSPPSTNPPCAKS